MDFRESGAALVENLNAAAGKTVCSLSKKGFVTATGILPYAIPMAFVPPLAKHKAELIKNGADASTRTRLYCERYHLINPRPSKRGRHIKHGLLAKTGDNELDRKNAQMYERAMFKLKKQGQDSSAISQIINSETSDKI
jgi:hypothetical protein